MGFLKEQEGLTAENDNRFRAALTLPPWAYEGMFIYRGNQER